MSSVSASALTIIPDDNTAEPRKIRAPSARLQQALNHLATKGVNQREAAKLAGISETHLCRELKKPAIRVFIERAARQKIAGGMLRAANRVMELVDASSEHVSAEMSKHVLAIGGIKPTADAQVSVNVDIKAGFVIDISEPTPRPRIVDVTHD